MKKILSLIVIIFICYSLCSYAPRFLDFMETQTDILCIKNTNPKVEFQNVENIIRETEIAIIEEPKIEETPEPIVEVTPEPSQEPVTPPVVQQESVSSRASTNTSGWVEFVATGYCPCMSCCGKTNGITASGTQATAGRTVAMPSNYSFGTQIEIEGYGTYVVEDRGGAIKSNRIDIYFNTHQEALNFGRRTVKLRVL